jgi:cell pole-organizing protein PopZ
MSQAPAQREEPSMEDILSSIRKIIQSNDDGTEDVAATAEVAPEPATAPVETAAEITAEPVKAAPSQPEVSDEGELTDAPARAREVVAKKVEPAIEPEVIEPVAKVEKPQTQASAQAPAQAETQIPAQASTNSALISAGPKAKVVASFAQLNDAITASSSQSLEEMTNDLLKPMLQEWLDNNLPGLVEKLVREEIERVARGGHES